MFLLETFILLWKVYILQSVKISLKNIQWLLRYGQKKTKFGQSVFVNILARFWYFYLKFSHFYGRYILNYLWKFHRKIFSGSWDMSEKGKIRTFVLKIRTFVFEKLCRSDIHNFIDHWVCPHASELCSDNMSAYNTVPRFFIIIVIFFALKISTRLDLNLTWLCTYLNLTRNSHLTMTYIFDYGPSIWCGFICVCFLAYHPFF